MKPWIFAITGVLVVAACTEAVDNNKSCWERANTKFDKCVASPERGGCAITRLREAKACDEQAARLRKIPGSDRAENQHAPD